MLSITYQLFLLMTSEDIIEIIKEVAEGVIEINNETELVDGGSSRNIYLIILKRCYQSI